MNVHTSLLGIYQPGPGWLFRLPVGRKYGLMLLLALPPVFLFQWWATLAALVIVLGILLSSGISLRKSLDIGGYLWFLLALLAFYQLLGNRTAVAFVSPGNVLLAVLAARMLTLTTSVPMLLDTLVRGLQPLRWIKVNPDAVALMIALMLRSIPFLAGSVEDTRMAARARGLERKLPMLLTPVVVGAVAYAQRTGEALQARGLPDDRL